MPIIRVELWKGTSKETKAELAKTLSEDLSRIAGKRMENITVLFTDYETHDWALGGELACDIDWSKR